MTIFAVKHHSQKKKPVSDLDRTHKHFNEQCNFASLTIIDGNVLVSLLFGMGQHTDILKNSSALGNTRQSSSIIIYMYIIYGTAIELYSVCINIYNVHVKII